MAVPLFHGPTSRETAVRWAEATGRLIAPPFGEGGLDIETSRNIIEILGSTPVGDQLGTVVVGPMDQPKSVDAVEVFLKTLEDLPESIVRVALWAEDAADVISTVRSRSEEKWCPPNPEATPEAPYLSIAETLCEAALRRRTASVVEMFKAKKRKASSDVDGEDEDPVVDEATVVGIEEEVARASAVVLATKEEWPLSARLKLWESLREVLATRNPSRQSYLAAYLV